MGIFEVFFSLKKILKIRKNIINQIKKIKPDIFIGIDFPEFNFSIEKIVKKFGIPVVHYVSPTVWAWRKKRIINMQKFIDKIFLLFPFEKEIYKNYSIPYEFVGHCLAKNYPIYYKKKEKKNFRLLILPGSRKQEIRYVIPTFLKCAKLLKKKIKKIEIFILFGTEEIKKIIINKKNKITPDLSVQIVQFSKEVLLSGDFALVTSGTATLECMLAKCPMIVGYKMNFFSYLIVRMLIKIKWISIPNILAKKKIVKEFVQFRLCYKNLFKETITLLSNKKKIDSMKKEFTKLHKSILRNTNKKLAFSIISMIYKNKKCL
ncbi:hypothetical protein AOQ89_01340 [bacterium endosymbiont of Pedicinus badii]|nr:hypothetical protein AOQ89_01340 [bacterium endosymbiont of Pedicinus badii]